MSGVGCVLAGMSGAASSGAVITIANATVSGFNSGAPASASYSLDATGDLNYIINGTPSDQGDWVTPKGDASLFEARATIVSGGVTGSATGSWLALSSTVTWTVGRATVGSNTATITVEIRDVATSTVQDTATITIEAERV